MSTTTPESTRRGIAVVPVYVWIVAVVGAVAGALLAGDGGLWSDTVPSVLTFGVAGLVLGLLAWGLTAWLRRS